MSEPLSVHSFEDNENADQDYFQLSLPSDSSEGTSVSQSTTKCQSQSPGAALIVSDIQNISEEMRSINLVQDHRVCCNVKEKIIIALDRCKDEDLLVDNFDNSYMPLAVLKKSVEMFVHLKSSINKQHEFALVLLEENRIKWVLDFTSNVKEFLKALSNVNECSTEDIFDMNSLFNEISTRVDIPYTEEHYIPPPYIVRVVLIYNRSYTSPSIKFDKNVEEIVDSPYFTLDILIAHRPIDSDNNVEKIFTILQSIDKKGFSYFFSVGRDMNALMKAMAKLLSHPLQRPIQANANYSI